ncbi:MAG: histidine--tRNA ligase [Clostridia bacterium]
MITSRPRGTMDLTPADTPGWRHIESVAREVCRRYGYGEIRTPIFEHTELFQRSVGEFTDVVEKEMYTFDDRGGRSLTLRPEGTAPAARLYLEERLYAEAAPSKIYYLSWPIFRYERPQAGRLRQHHQFGVECFGSEDPAVDAEIMALARDFLEELGLEDLVVGLNSMGCPGCRGDYREALRLHFEPHLDEMCDDCRRRHAQNPLRLLDCKEDRCQPFIKSAPAITDYLCEDCREHFDHLKAYLDGLGVQYELDPSLVRGFDYYTGTVFEITHRALGAQDVVCGGGRYDNLVETLGGDPSPGVGFGLGIERLLLILEREGVTLPVASHIDAYLVCMGEDVRRWAVRLLHRLRGAGLSADMDYMDRSFRSQMRRADKYPARFAVILGEEELEAEKLTLREMESGDQETLDFEAAVERLRGHANSEE